jgi:hypothetical protein
LAEEKASGINSSTATTHKIWGVPIQAFVVSEAAFFTGLRQGNVPAEKTIFASVRRPYLLLVFLCVFSRHVVFTLFGFFEGSLVPSTSSVGVSLCSFSLSLFFFFFLRPRQHKINDVLFYCSFYFPSFHSHFPCWIFLCLLSVVFLSVLFFSHFPMIVAVFCIINELKTNASEQMHFQVPILFSFCCFPLNLAGRGVYAPHFSRGLTGRVGRSCSVSRLSLCSCVCVSLIG